MSFITARSAARDIDSLFSLLAVLANPEECKKLAAQLKADADKAIEGENAAAALQQQNQAKSAEMIQEFARLEEMKQNLEKAQQSLIDKQQAFAQERLVFDGQVEVHRKAYIQSQKAIADAKAAQEQREATFTRTAQQRVVEQDRREAALQMKENVLLEGERIFNQERTAWQKRVDEIRQLTA